MEIKYVAQKSFNLDNSDLTFLHFALEVVMEKGTGYIYRTDEFGGCVNVYTCSTGEVVPACLIGTILVRLGVPTDWFEAEGLTGQNALNVMEPLGFSKRVIRAARAGQMAQDNGQSWGAALTRMIETYAKLNNMSDIQIDDYIIDLDFPV